MTTTIWPHYQDVTEEWLNTATPNSHPVKDRHYFKTEDGRKYYVDGKDVVLDYSLEEKEIAEWLARTLGGEIYMNPRVNQPEGMQTADYLFRGEYWDLKMIQGCGKQSIYHSVYKKNNQNRILF